MPLNTIEVMLLCKLKGHDSSGKEESVLSLYNVFTLIMDWCQICNLSILFCCVVYSAKIHIKDYLSR